MHLDAIELLEKVDVEVRAAEFAVSDAVQAKVLLELDDIADRGVLGLAQIRLRARALLVLLARLEQRLGGGESCRRGRRERGAWFSSS